MTSASELIDYLVQWFGDQAEKIPESVGVLHVCLWVTFLRVNEVRELHRVANEEYRCVVAHHVPVSFFRVKFNWKSTRVPSSVREARFTCHSGPSPENLRLLANFAQEFGLAQVSHIPAHPKRMGTRKHHQISFLCLFIHFFARITVANPFLISLLPI